MTCEELERRLTEGMDSAAADVVQAHVLGCERCAALMASRALWPGDLPQPPAGFAHVTAVTARMTATPAAPPRYGLHAALVFLLASYAVVAIAWMSGGLPPPAASESIGGMAGVVVAVEAAALMAGLMIWLQAPPTRRRS